MQDLPPEVTNKDIYALIQSVLSKNIEIQKEIKDNKDLLTQEIADLKQEFSKQFQDLKKENDDLKRENNELKEKLNIIERRAKKYNLIIYGLTEEEDNKEDIQNFLAICNDTLKLRCTFSDFRDIYRIGKLTEGKTRPLLIEVVNYQLKAEILKNARDLKGTGIFVAQDNTPTDYDNKKILVTNLKLARNHNLQAKIKNYSLLIEDEEYTVEDLKKNIPKKIIDARDKVTNTQTENNNAKFDENRATADANPIYDKQEEDRKRKNREDSPEKSTGTKPKKFSTSHQRSSSRNKK